MFNSPPRRKKKNTSLQTWFTIGLICVVAVVFLAVFILIADDGTSAVENFLDLDDTPNSYAGSANLIVTVNPAETGLIFTTSGTAGIPGLQIVTNVGATTTNVLTVGGINFNGNDITNLDSITGNSTLVRVGTGTSSHGLTDSDDILFSDDVEINGVAWIDGGLQVSGVTAFTNNITVIGDIGLTGGITATSTISASAFDGATLWNLTDTNTGTNNAIAADGQALVWDAANSWWEPGTVSSVSSGTPSLQAVTDIGNHTTNSMDFAGGTVTASLYLRANLYTDYYLDSNTNTLLGVGAAGAGNMSHTTGNEGWYNTGIGNTSLYSNTTGYFNSAVGVYALYANSTGYFNSAVGVNALYNNTTGYFNSAVGVNALKLNTTGFQNSAMGMVALNKNTTGYNNSAMGYQAGRYIAAGGANATGNNSLFLGYNTRALADGQTNQIVIGASAIGLGSNTVVLGAESVTTTALRGDLLLEGSTSDANETILSVEDPTADRSIVFPDASGTVALTSDLVGTVSYEIVLTPGGGIVPTTGGADQSMTDGTNFSYYTLAFDPTADESVYWEFIIPSTYTSGSITPTIYWTGTPVANDVIWNVQTVGRADSEQYDVALGGTHSVVTTIDGTTLDINTSTIAAFDPGWDAGDIVIWKIFRDANNPGDTMVGDANMIMAKIEWPANKE